MLAHTKTSFHPMHQNALGAYDKNSKTVEASNITDAIVLEQSAMAMERLPDDVSIEKWVSTLKHNSNIWSVIQCEMIDGATHLPDTIKANIISLSIFIDKKTLDCLQQTTRNTNDLSSLISINRNIALGLRGDTGI